MNSKIQNDWKEFTELAYSLQNVDLRKACITLMDDCGDAIKNRPAGHARRMGRLGKAQTHHCHEGGLLEHLLAVTKHSTAMAKIYGDMVDMDLVTFGAMFHDIGKIETFDEWSDINLFKQGNRNAVDMYVEHVYSSMRIVEKYLERTDISHEYMMQILHVIGTHMDTLEKHMAEAYIVSYADTVDAYVTNILNYPRDDWNPIDDVYYFRSKGC